MEVLAKARVNMKDETVSVKFDRWAFSDMYLACQAYAIRLKEEGCENYGNEVWSICEKLEKAFDKLHEHDLDD